jgi:signal transduction histidine kinase
MRRRTKLVLSITLMVAALAIGLSIIYISQILRQLIIQANDTASQLTSQLLYVTNNAAPDLSSTKVDTNNPAAVNRDLAYYLSTDRDLNVILTSVVSSWPTVYDAAIVDTNGKAILHSSPDLVGKVIQPRQKLQLVQDARFRRQMRMIYSAPMVYDVETPLVLNNIQFGSIRVGISTVFLKNEITPLVQRAAVYCCIAVLLSLILAASLSRLALGPLEQISKRLDSVSAGETVSPTVEEGENVGDEYGLVTLKIAHLGRQMRDTKEIFSALKDNVDQIMANLQDGLMLFTRDSRVVLVSASVEKFLGIPRHALLGKTAKDIFSPGTPLGALVLEGFQLRKAFGQSEIEAAGGRCIQAALDFIHEGGTQIGALLTMHDTESVRRIESEIETSRRLSASGRLTRGVAHEVKNPINAIVLHLQLLQNKLQQTDPDTRRHIDIIDSEIHRLDRVVQILVDFTRPRDLHLDQLDLKHVLEDVGQLAAPDAEQHGVNLRTTFPEETLPVTADSDFIKQAVLNVVLNGVQAMTNGGNLWLSARREGETVVTEIRDEGLGIPRDLQEKVFELYFTTKPGGSGIGLAQTFQIMQWHYGSVEFESQDGKGTTFRLRLPLTEVRTNGTKEDSVEPGLAPASGESSIPAPAR